MRKKLVFLAFALAATAATAVSHAQIINSCPPGSHRINCPTYSFCCPNNALCICAP